MAAVPSSFSCSAETTTTSQQGGRVRFRVWLLQFAHATAHGSDARNGTRYRPRAYPTMQRCMGTVCRVRGRGATRTVGCEGRLPPSDWLTGPCGLPRGCC
ncbi:hypothetical protein DVS28_a3640 [Euzebya pacifica]|uniref:Uncharacterized protein n=1 Tax=Euzebya pacifica TaxID=1608957 RepID=A0A346Y1G6_9ACTN|nr:hypothetical protein DVS28_a3640 [Euzebya pacifica]